MGPAARTLKQRLLVAPLGKFARTLPSSECDLATARKYLTAKLFEVHAQVSISGFARVVGRGQVLVVLAAMVRLCRLQDSTLVCKITRVPCQTRLSYATMTSDARRIVLWAHVQMGQKDLDAAYAQWVFMGRLGKSAKNVRMA